MKLIKLTQGYVTKVDDEDYEWLNQWKWYAGTRNHYGTKTVRVVRSVNLGKHASGKQKIVQVQMAREILRARFDERADHINGDTLDNRKSNLRLCSEYQNQLNKGMYRRNTSGYKGVSYVKANKKWGSHIRYEKKLIHLGYFEDKKEAARAYNEAAKKYFGEFARLNKI